MKCSLGISNFLEEISSLSFSVLFLYFFVLTAEEGFLISSCYSLELCSQMLISFLFSFAFRFSSFHNYWLGLLRQPFCISFSWGWSRSLKGPSCGYCCSVVSHSSRPQGLQPTRLLCPWDFPDKTTGVRCHCLLQNALKHL